MKHCPWTERRHLALSSTCTSPQACQCEVLRPWGHRAPMPPPQWAPNLSTSTFLPGTPSPPVFSKVLLQVKGWNVCMLLCWRIQSCTAEMLTSRACSHRGGRSEWVVGCFTREKESAENRVFSHWPFCEAHPPGFTIRELLDNHKAHAYPLY